MINISKIKLTLDQVIDPKFNMLLLHSKPWLKYENGKATSEELGTQYEVVVDGDDYDKFWVKVPDADIRITEEEIQNAKERMVVRFTNATCALYLDANNQIQISVKAEAIDVV